MSIRCRALLCVLFLPFTNGGSFSCHICGSDLDEQMKWPNAVIKADGTTCSLQSVNIAGYSGEDCEREQYFWSDVCCGDSEPRNVRVAPTPAPALGGRVGDNDECDLCIGGDFPSNTNMVLNMLYIGTGSCHQWYDTGKLGGVPNHLCDALRFFAYEPCGCGDFNTWCLSVSIK